MLYTTDVIASDYDVIGRGYAARRIADPRIAAQIVHALGDARSVCNVGAGAGSYEPQDRMVVAVEPSREMIAQRTRHAVVRARAEALPFRDATFDVSMAMMTVHHWSELARGIAELRRIARRSLVFTFDPALQDRLWLVREYVPEITALEATRAPGIARLVELLGGAEVQVVPIPWDCQDGFQAAYWRRPERYLLADVRASISTLAMLPQRVIDAAMRRLQQDLASGAWAERHADLLARDAMDYGYRLLVAPGRD